LKYLDRNTWFWLLISALFFLPFLGGVHLFDWDEINFAELAREMVVTGEWLRMQINYELFTEKPPLFFWLQALAMSIFGVGEYAARFPNALLGVFVLPFLYVSGKFLIDRKFGFLWSLSWFGSILPFLYFKSGIIDPFFNFFIFNGLFFLIHFFWKRKNQTDIHLSRKASSYLLLGGISVGLAILTKGPVAYLLIFLTVAVYFIINRNGFTANLGALLKYSFFALGIFLLWFAVDALLHGPDFIVEFTIRQWELLTTNDAGHGGFPGYHFVVLLLGCFPASIFAIRGLGRIEGIKPHVQDFQQWMIILLAVVVVLFSLVGTKIIHYSSMAYYPISFLSALALWNFSEFPRRKPYWIGISVVVIGLIAVIVSFSLPIAGMNIEEVKPLFKKDPFASANLNAQVEWTYLDFIPGIILFLAILLYMAYQQKHPLFSVRMLFFGTALWTFTGLISFIGKIESISQRAAVEFYQSYQGEEVYVTTFGYKSYVPWFYSKVMPYANPKANEREWLYHGEVDQKVIISTKVHRKSKLMEEIPDAKLLYAKNGFYFFVREPASVK
jgi:4-amino-4-deoxy-L-arabinose transferase-like glycosyltransferase